jgi:hypothetical protein
MLMFDSSNSRRSGTIGKRLEEYQEVEDILVILWNICII